MSSISWVAFSEGERKRTLDILQLFSESGTLDELGVGRVRDAFSDLLFPGTSTIQTRARYFLLIPWIYLDLERRSKVANASTMARRQETKLIEKLREQASGGAGDTVGLIGGTAGANLVQLPSQIYWQGLLKWGIRSKSGQRSVYHRLLETQSFQILSASDEMGTLAVDPSWWDRDIPDAPDDLWSGPTLALTHNEAEYLQQMVTFHQPVTMLSELVGRGKTLPDSALPWHLPQSTRDGLSPGVSVTLKHAENFSLTMNGSAILFNLMLAELKADGEGFADQYRQTYQDWVASVEEESGPLSNWFGSAETREAFWNVARKANPSLPSPREREFIEGWINIAISDPGAAIDSEIARRLIRERELRLKGPNRAKLASASALEAWKGGSGAPPLDYRWRTVRTLVNDVAEGLASPGATESGASVAGS